MTTTITSPFHTSNLRSLFPGEKNGLNTSTVRTNRIGFAGKNIVCKESRVGKKPITVPPNVKIVLEEQGLEQGLKVTGPLGEMSITYPREVKVEQEESGILRVSRARETRKASQMHGLFRTLTNNMLVGVSQGFEKKLQLVGVGYRAVVENDVLVLSLGFSHLVKMPIPKDMKVKVEDSTMITVSGYDKVAIGDFAASIRRWRPPEPYKGKGVRYEGEVVRLKEGKAGKKKE
ncbi:hypothetical protein Droror1_Dr00019396 [Drosera rotundifolia]